MSKAEEIIDDDYADDEGVDEELEMPEDEGGFFASF